MNTLASDPDLAGPSHSVELTLRENANIILEKKMNTNVWEGIVSHTYIQLTSFTHNKVYCMKLQLHDGVCHYVFIKLLDCSAAICRLGCGSMATSSLSGSWPHGFRCLTCFALRDCGAAAGIGLGDLLSRPAIPIKEKYLEQM